MVSPMVSYMVHTENTHYTGAEGAGLDASSYAIRGASYHKIYSAKHMVSLNRLHNYITHRIPGIGEPGLVARPPHRVCPPSRVSVIF